MALKAKGASFEVVREALINHTDQWKARDWARASNSADLRRLYDNASPERLLRVSDFVAFSPKGQAIFTSTGDLWVMASVDDRVPPPGALVDLHGQPRLRRQRRSEDAISEFMAGDSRARRADDMGSRRTANHHGPADGGGRLDNKKKGGRVQSLSAAAASALVG